VLPHRVEVRAEPGGGGVSVQRDDAV